MIYLLREPYVSLTTSSVWVTVAIIIIFMSFVGCGPLEEKAVNITESYSDCMKAAGNENPGDCIDIKRSYIECKTQVKLADCMDIDVGIVWHKEKKQFREGAILAAEEINAVMREYGIYFRLHFTEASSFLKKHHVERSVLEGRYRNAKQLAGSDIAHKVVARKSLSAVISADIPVESTLASVVVYQEHDVLVMNASSSNSSIDWLANDLYFQLLPPNKILAKKIATEIKRQNWESIFITYIDTAHKGEMIELIRTELSSLDIELVGSYGMQLGIGNLNRGHKGRLRASLAELRTNDTDAIILLMPPKQSAQVIRFAREIGVLQPFLGEGEYNSSKEFIKIVGDRGIGTRTTTLDRANDYQVKLFKQKFISRFHNKDTKEVKVDVSAMMGYDSVRLFAQGVASANTVVPIRVSEALNYRLPIWFSLLGSYSFTDGESTHIDYSIQQLKRQNIKGKSVLGFFTDDIN
jgi:ABC-type branched-subunit amino acid transport system substrate-binding protein